MVKRIIDLVDKDIVIESIKFTEDLKRGLPLQIRIPVYDIRSNKHYQIGYDGDNGR
jgi:hypothetical protein